MDTDIDETKQKPTESSNDVSESPIECTYIDEVPENESKEVKTEDNEEEKTEVNTQCGIGPCHPQCIQIFASKKFFTFMLCVFGLVEGALISGFQPVVVSSIERRYRFSSTAASVIIIVFDIAVVISVVFISYAGEKAHKPRWMGAAFFLQGIGALIFSLPHFIFGKYDVGSITNSSMLPFESCNNPLETVADCDAGNTGAYVLLLVGNVIMGIAAAPLFTVGVSFIDDIVLPKYVSLHVGAFQVSTILGPALGFGISSAFLRLYVDVGEPTNLTESDPAWVGAWWLSFILAAGLSVILSIPFFFFPRALPDTHLMTEARQKQMKGNYTSKFRDEETFLERLKAFPFHLLGLFKSKSWLFMTLAICTLFLSLDGLVTFAPKYIESVYRIVPSTAGLIVGALGIVAGVLGTLTGAGISHCVKIGKNLGIVNWVVVTLAIFPLVGFFLICPNVDVVGIGTQYTNKSAVNFTSSLSSASRVLLASCNADCNCTSTIFEPVCGSDGLTYFSPCRASCQQIGDSFQNVTYENCGCVASNLYSNDTQADFNSVLANSTASRGLCLIPCSFLPGFIALVAVFVVLIFSIRVPFLLVTIRAVAEEQRSFALGVQSLMFRVFGSIPGPLLFGVIVDSGCVYAQYECGRLANCWVYDNNLLSVRAYIFCTIGVAACIVFSVLSWIFYPPVGLKLAPPDDEIKYGEAD